MAGQISTLTEKVNRLKREKQLTGEDTGTPSTPKNSGETPEIMPISKLTHSYNERTLEGGEMR